MVLHFIFHPSFFFFLIFRLNACGQDAARGKKNLWQHLWMCELPTKDLHYLRGTLGKMNTACVCNPSLCTHDTASVNIHVAFAFKSLNSAQIQVIDSERGCGF